jgi:glycosyltransferase involved in cell wall biosynthesis
MPKTIGLAMIVKNEEKNIIRALETVTFDKAVINYSGSTDATEQIITDWMEANGKDSLLIAPEWLGAADGLNACIEFLAEMEVDWVLRIDADTCLEGNLPNLEKLDEDIDGIDCRILREDGSFISWRPFLFKPSARYKGVRHEGLYCNRRVQTEEFFIRHYDDSGARPREDATYADDFQAMGNSLPMELDSGLIKRYAFYMANSARDGGDLFQASLWFRMRMEMEGYDGEVQVSAREHALIVNAPEFWLKAINDHPSRPDMVFWALVGGQQFGLVFVRQVIECCDEKAWVDGQMFMQDSYRWKTIDQIAIAWLWLGDEEKSLEMTNRVLSEFVIPEADMERVLARIAPAEDQNNSGEEE